jgi:hypothetical protein
VESEEGAAEAADDGGLDGGAGEGAEAEVEEGGAAAAAAASGCEGGGASMLFDELPGRSAGAELVYCEDDGGGWSGSRCIDPNW